MTFVVEPALPAGLMYVPPPEAIVPVTLPAATDGDGPLGYTLTPVPAAVRTAAAGRAVVLIRYAEEAWTPVAGATDDREAGRICAVGVRAFGPLAVGYANGAQTVPPQTHLVHEAIAPLMLPAVPGGDVPVRYTLTPLDALPAGLSYMPPADPTATGGVIAGTPTTGQSPTVYTLTATDGDADTLPVSLEGVRIPVQVTITDATAVDGSAGRLTLAAGTTAGTLAVPTVDDRRVEPTETFTVTGTLPADPLIEGAEATDAVDVIRGRFLRQPTNK